jgi:hypothetical protein
MPICLKPIIVKPEPVRTPQCCIPVDPPTRAQHWRRDRYEKLRPEFDASLCQRESVIQHNGKHYCRVHAGQLALNMWLAGDLVEKTS